MVTTLQNFWLKHRKAILMGGFLIVGALILPHLVQAQAPAPPPAPQSSTDVANQMLSGLSQILKLLQVIFWPILMMIGSLMQNDILFGAGLESRLLEIWVNVRNIVNILFVLILLGIALYNVMGAGENYHFKTILPKFVIALIAVNFTFIGVKVVLDGVNIVSTAIFALPDSVEQTLKGKTSTGETDTKQKVGLFNVDEINGMCSAMFGGEVGSSEYKTNIEKALTETKQQTICNSTADSGGSYLAPNAVSFFNSMNTKNAALVMAITLQRANLLDKVYVNVESPTAGKLVINTLFSIILYVVYGTAYVALFVTLLIRLVVLWVMIAVSPLMVLPSVLPESIKGMLGEGGDMAKKFVKNAMVPIPVALVMSIGFIMLRGLQTTQFTAGADKFINNPTLSLDLLTSGLTTLQSLLVAFGAIGFIWVGVFEAMKGTYAEGVVSGIKGAVEGAGKTLGKFAVGSIPLFPTAKGPASIGAVGVALQQLPNIPRQRWQQEAAEKFPGLMMKGGEIGQKLGQSKDLAGFKKQAKDTAPSMLTDPAIQKGWSEFFEKDGKKYVNTDLQKWLAGTKYAGKPKDFLEDLKQNKVDSATFKQIHDQAGIQLSSGELPKAKSAEEAAKQGQLPAEQKALFDKKQQEKLVKDGTLSQAETKEIGDLEKKIKAAEGNKDPKKLEEANKAKERLAQLADKVKKTEDLGTDVSVVIKQNTTGTPTAQNAQYINDGLEQKILAVSGGKAKGTPEYEAAKEKVLKTAAEKMTDDQQKALEAVAPAGSNLAAAIEKRKTMKPAAPPPAGPPKPPGPPPANPPPQKPPAGPPPPLPKVKANDPRLKDMGNPKPGDKVSLPVPGGGTQEYIVE